MKRRLRPGTEPLRRGGVCRDRWGQVWVPPALARAVLRTPRCPVPASPRRPPRCPTPHTGTERSGKPSTGRRLQKIPGLTLKTTTAQTGASDNLHSWRDVCFSASPSAPFLWSSPGVLHVSAGEGTVPGAGEPAAPPPPSSSAAGKTGSSAVAERSWEAGWAPRRETKVEAEPPSCPGASGVTGASGAPQIAVGRVAAAPQGCSYHVRPIRGEGKVCSEPRKRLCLPPLLQAPGSHQHRQRGHRGPTAHPHLQVALSVQKGLWKEIATPLY